MRTYICRLLNKTSQQVIVFSCEATNKQEALDRVIVPKDHELVSIKRAVEKKYYSTKAEMGSLLTSRFMFEAADGEVIKKKARVKNGVIYFTIERKL